MRICCGCLLGDQFCENAAVHRRSVVDAQRGVEDGLLGVWLDAEEASQIQRAAVLIPRLEDVLAVLVEEVNLAVAVVANADEAFVADADVEDGPRGVQGPLVDKADIVAVVVEQVNKPIARTVSGKGRSGKAQRIVEGEGHGQALAAAEVDNLDIVGVEADGGEVGVLVLRNQVPVVVVDVDRAVLEVCGVQILLVQGDARVDARGSNDIGGVQRVDAVGEARNSAGSRGVTLSDNNLGRARHACGADREAGAAVENDAGRVPGSARGVQDVNGARLDVATAVELKDAAALVGGDCDFLDAVVVLLDGNAPRRIEGRVDVARGFVNTPDEILLSEIQLQSLRHFEPRDFFTLSPRRVGRRLLRAVLRQDNYYPCCPSLPVRLIFP